MSKTTAALRRIARPAGPDTTAEVTRETIAATEAWSGTLGHGDPFTVTTPAQGTVTRIAEQDSEIKRGTELYRVDEQSVTALYGDVPMYRELASGNSGRDVKQLEANLEKLGYDGFTADNTYTWATALAVQEWQDDIGAEETGAVEPSDVVFVPESGRVDTIDTDVGGTLSQGSAVLDITGVEVTLDENVDESLFGSPVDVVVDVDEREDVLVVPVNALLALPEGDHGLEVVADDGTTTIVPVETGLFADGKVEVTGEGIDEGTVVGAAGR